MSTILVCGTSNIKTTINTLDPKEETYFPSFFFINKSKKKKKKKKKKKHRKKQQIQNEKKKKSPKSEHSWRNVFNEL